LLSSTTYVWGVSHPEKKVAIMRAVVATARWDPFLPRDRTRQNGEAIFESCVVTVVTPRAAFWASPRAPVINSAQVAVQDQRCRGQQM